MSSFLGGKKPVEVHAAVWVPDNEATICMHCNKTQFTVLNRRVTILVHNSKSYFLIAEMAFKHNRVWIKTSRKKWGLNWIFELIFIVWKIRSCKGKINMVTMSVSKKQPSVPKIIFRTKSQNNYNKKKEYLVKHYCSVPGFHYLQLILHLN